MRTKIKFWGGFSIFLVLGIAMFIGYSVAIPNVEAEASAGACEDAYFTSVSGGADHVDFTAPGGTVIVAVCIKSGNNMFGGDKHSGPLGNGTYENGCYTVSGVGTEYASIDRNFDGPDCQGISHGDAYITEVPPTLPPDTATAVYTLTHTPTATLESTPTSTEENTPTATLTEFVPTLIPSATPDPCLVNPERCVTATLTVTPQGSPTPTATAIVRVYIPVCRGCIGANGNWWETPSGSPGWQNNLLEGEGPLGVEVAVVTDDCIVDKGRCVLNQFVHVLYDTSIGEVTFVDNGVTWDLGPAHTAPNGRSYVYYVGRVCDAFLDKDRTKCHSSNDYQVYVNGVLQNSFKRGGLLYNYWPCSLAPNQGMIYLKDGKWVLDWEPGFTTADLIIFSMKYGLFDWPDTWPDDPQPGHWNWNEDPLKSAKEWANSCQANGLFEPCELPNQ